MSMISVVSMCELCHLNTNTDCREITSQITIPEILKSQIPMPPDSCQITVKHLLLWSLISSVDWTTGLA